MAILQDLENKLNQLNQQREGAFGQVQESTQALNKANSAGTTFGDVLQQKIRERAAAQSPLFERNAEAKANYRTFLGDELPKLKGTFNDESQLLGAVDNARQSKLQDVFHTENLLNNQQSRLEDIIPMASNAYQQNYVQPKLEALQGAQQQYEYLNQLFGEANQGYQFEKQMAAQAARGSGGGGAAGDEEATDADIAAAVTSLLGDEMDPEVIVRTMEQAFGERGGSIARNILGLSGSTAVEVAPTQAASGGNALAGIGSALGGAFNNTLTAGGAIPNAINFTRDSLAPAVGRGLENTLTAGGAIPDAINYLRNLFGGKKK